MTRIVAVFVLFVLSVVPSFAQDKKEFMTADQILAIQAFKGKQVTKKGNAAHGRQTYAFYCTPCHGMEGKGDGHLAKLLDPKPRNHTDGKGTRPGDGMNDRTDEQLFKAITTGGQGINKSVNMPAWGHIISETGRWNLIAYMRSIANPPYVAK
ncbi:MAG: cytochrome c [Nitrospirota bacterium]